MKYGYARVSPGGKSESVDAQARQLTKAGCRKVIRDVHVSGAKTERTQLRRVIETLGPGDVLMVARLDRLARSTAAHCDKYHSDAFPKSTPAILAR